MARRRKMSAEAIIRAGSDIGAAAIPTPERPLTVEEAVMSLVQHSVSAARAARSRLDENEEDQSIQQDECEGVEGTVSTNATHDHTHKNSPGKNLTDAGNPSLEEASNNTKSFSEPVFFLPNILCVHVRKLGTSVRKSTTKSDLQNLQN